MVTAPAAHGGDGLLVDGSVPAGGDFDWGDYDLTNVGKLIVGSDEDLGAPFQVKGADVQIEGRSSDTTNTTKQFKVGVSHYNNSEQPSGVFFASSESGFSYLCMGGGTGSVNAMEEVRFYTAANDTTTTGTEAMRINSAQNVLVGSDADLGGALQVKGGVSSVEVRDNDTADTLKLGAYTWSHYDNAELRMGIYGYCAETSNVIRLGGGTGSLNAATRLEMYLGATTTTPTGTEMVRVTTAGMRVQTGGTMANALAPLHADQAATDGATPALYIDQADVSEEMIEFACTIGEGNAIEAVGAKALTTTHFIKCTITGVGNVYIPCGTIAGP